MSTIRVTGRLRVGENKLDTMKEFVAQMKAVVAEKEAGRTLVYDFYQSDDDPQLCLIHEGYADEVAFDVHMNNIVQVAARYPNLFAVESVQVCGNLSNKRRAEVAAHFGNVFKFFSGQL